jgi:hypothetical protein
MPRDGQTRTYPVHTHARPKALIVHCGDPRFKVAFRRFIAEDLDLTESQHILAVLAGGVASLTEPESLHSDFHFVKDKLAFYLTHFPSIEDLTLINHQGCGKYASLHQHFGEYFLLKHGVRSLEDRVRNDLPMVRDTIQQHLPRPVRINLFYTKFVDGEHTAVTFEEIA